MSAKAIASKADASRSRRPAKADAVSDEEDGGDSVQIPRRRRMVPMPSISWCGTTLMPAGGNSANFSGTAWSMTSWKRSSRKTAKRHKPGANEPRTNQSRSKPSPLPPSDSTKAWRYLGGTKLILSADSRKGWRTPTRRMDQVRVTSNDWSSLIRYSALLVLFLLSPSSYFVLLKSRRSRFRTVARSRGSAFCGRDQS